jgi:hypothetical protein
MKITPTASKAKRKYLMRPDSVIVSPFGYGTKLGPLYFREVWRITRQDTKDRSSEVVFSSMMFDCREALFSGLTQPACEL